MEINNGFNVENSLSGFGCAINEFAIELKSINPKRAIINFNYERIILPSITSKRYACAHTHTSYLIPSVSCSIGKHAPIISLCTHVCSGDNIYSC